MLINKLCIFFYVYKWWFIDINSGYENEYRSIVGDNSCYFYVLFYVNLFIIEFDVIIVIMWCFVL